MLSYVVLNIFVSQRVETLYRHDYYDEEISNFYLRFMQLKE
jgi:hypothetical protein